MSRAWNRYSRVVGKALDSLRWYRHTRPDALRHALVPGFVTLVTLLFALVWGQPQLIVLAVLFAAAFVLLAGELTGELRELDTDARSAATARSDIAPVDEVAAERPPEADVEQAASEPQGLPPLPAHEVEETESTTLALLVGHVRTSASAPPPKVEQAPSPEPAVGSPEPAAGPELMDGPMHEVQEPGAGPVLHSCRSFLDACDFAFDYLDQNDPDELEITLVTDGSRMRVWSYSRSDATAAQAVVEDGDRPASTDLPRQL